MLTPLTSDIERHYDTLSPLYSRFWGDHIHHGYWEGASDDAPERAQEKLIEKLVQEAGLQPNSTVLDVGCGLGGSSRWLAEKLDCKVTGITLSSVQVEMATARSKGRPSESKVNFLVADANELAFSPESFEVVWSVECIEHLLDKPKFLRAAADILKPGSRLAFTTWLDESRNEAEQELIANICQRMICPSLASLQDFRTWIEAAGLTEIKALNIAPQVKRTWTYCNQLLKRPDVKMILLMADRATKEFVESFPMMEQGYETGALGYGLFTATKPA